MRATKDRPLQVRVDEVSAAQVDLAQVEPGRPGRLRVAGFGKGTAAEHGQGGQGERWRI